MAEILSVNILQNISKEEGRATVMSFYGVGQNAGDDLFQPGLCIAGRDIYPAAGVLYNIGLWNCRKPLFFI